MQTVLHSIALLDSAFTQVNDIPNEIITITNSNTPGSHDQTNERDNSVQSRQAVTQTKGGI